MLAKAVQFSEATRRRIGWLAGHWRVYPGQAQLLVAFSVINAALVIVYPLLLKWIIDGIKDGLSAGYLLRNVLWLVGFGLVHFTMYGYTQWLRTRLNLRFQFGVRLRAFEFLLRLGAGFFGRFRTGDLITRLNDDVNDKLSWYMCSGIFRVVEALAIILTGLAAMLWISPRLTMYTAAPLPLLIGFFFITATRLHRSYEVVQQSISGLNDALESCFSGIRVVKAFAAEQHQRKLVERAIETNRIAEIRAVRWQTVIDSLYSNVWQLAFVGWLLVGGGMVIHGQLSLGDLVAMEAYTLMLVWPMFDVGQFLVRGRLSAVSIDRLREVETMPPEVETAAEPEPTPRRPISALPADYPPPGPRRADGLDIEFRGVAYRYPAATAAALAEVSFVAPAGKRTAIVGETGAGKSTLLALLPRLICPTAGSLWCGGVEISQWGLLDLRQAIGYVPQEALLLSGTVRENIRFGRDWISDDDLAMALEVCQLKDDVARWRAGLDTVVGSRGLRLSGGQKQRVALARAVAGRPRVLLLDDCTASLDAETEAAVWKALLSAIPDCTILLVTHRPSTLRQVDQIVVLEQGRVCQQGTFSQVDGPGTPFHRLYVRWHSEVAQLGDEVN